MGYQQVLLILLGVAIVCIAVIIAINLSNSHSTLENRDALVSDLTGISSLAQAYYRKPLKYGGGNNSFTDWQIPPQLVSTTNGNYTAEVGNQSIIMIGTGNKTGNDGTNPVKVTVVVGPDGILSTTVNN